VRRFPRPRLPRPSRTDAAQKRGEPGTPRPPRFTGIASQLRRARYAIEDAAFAAGRILVAAAERVSEFWFGLSLQARQRIALALGGLVAVVLLWVVAVPALPCQAPGGDTCPPADDAIHLVPENALAYVHVNVGPDTEQYKEAAKVASQVPALTDQGTGQLLSRLPGPNGAAPDFERDIQPWFGGEAALAIVPVGGRGLGQEVELLEVSDVDGAQKFAESVAAGKLRSRTYRDVQVQIDHRRLATALIGGFLAIGTQSGLRDVIDADSGEKGTGSLAGDPEATAARAALPDQRLADAYLSKHGIAELVANSRGPLATLASVINPDASLGVAVALVASDDGLDVDVRSELDPDRAKAHPGFFSAFPPFEPTLAAALPRDSLGYVGIGDAGTTLKSLLQQAGAEQPGLAAAVGDLVKQVKDLGNVDLEKDVLPSLGGEAAFALQPAPGGAGGNKGGGNAGTLPTSQIPFLEFIAADVDADRTTKALARLQAPIIQALNPSKLQVPAFSQHKIGDVTAHSVDLSPAVDLTYAIVGSSLVVATDPAAVQRVAGGEGGLDGKDLFDQATDGFPGDLSMLSYLNLRGLITLGESTGLAENPAYATFASEIHKLEALGLAIQSGSDELSTDARLIVGAGTGGGSGAGGPGGAAPTE
jgi:Protein of unknown function (DUF3352)